MNYTPNSAKNDDFYIFRRLAIFLLHDFFENLCKRVIRDAKSKSGIEIELKLLQRPLAPSSAKIPTATKKNSLDPELPDSLDSRVPNYKGCEKEVWVASFGAENKSH